MGVRMGICANNPEEYPRYECGMPWDSNFTDLLEYIKTSCLKCKKYKSDDEFACYGCYDSMDGYYILPKSILLENPSTICYDEMLKLFEEENVDTIYIILY